MYVKKMKGRIKNLALKYVKIRPPFFQLPMFVGVSIIIKNPKGEILLGKRDKRMYSYPGFWGLPGGFVDQGEMINKAAKREVKEEMGIDIELIKKSKNIYETKTKNKSTLHSIGIIVYARVIKGIPKPCDETEEVGWFTKAKIKKMKLAYNHKEILKKEGILK